ncbi:MAG: hypothetical protein LBV54_03205 [Puniceicoccales bacterium]|jgi:hypothetical protein|nr:hypothetical protein [Puniceicoccales bacterium]
MKNSTCISTAFSLFLLACSAAVVCADDTAPQTPPQKQTPQAVAPPATTTAPLGALSREELRALIRIIDLPPEKLASLREAIIELEKMPLEKRRELGKKLKEDLHTTRKPGEPMRPESPRNNPLLRYWRSLPPEKAREEQNKFWKMTPEERRAYSVAIREKLPPPPPPHFDHRRGDRNKEERPAPPPPPPPPQPPVKSPE